MPSLNLYWGDSHTNLHLRLPEAAVESEGATPSSAQLTELEKAFDHARKVLDFWPIAYYPYHYVVDKGIREEMWRPQKEVDHIWREICRLASANSEDGRFVTFPGYEWQGDARHGDHNVFFCQDDAPILRSSTLPELYADIRRMGLKALAIPHHTAYKVGVRGKDWSVHDERISPFAEVFSKHGCSETDEELIGLRSNPHMGPGVSGGTMADGLDMGIKIGIVASNDSHYGIAAVHGMGLMACYAEQLTRQSLWEAFAARRVYGVTGDRIELDFRVESALMGGEVKHSGAVAIETAVRGSDAIDRIELLRNNRVIATHCHNGTWQLAQEGRRIRAKIRVEVGWGALSEDIDDMPPRDWNCRIDVPEGNIISAEPCWKTAGQWIGKVGGASCQFGFRTAQSGHDGGPVTEAGIFEIEARPEDALKIDTDGKLVEMDLSEAMAGSRIVDFMDEAADYFSRTAGLDPAKLDRPDWLYFCGHKAKIHKAIPECGLTAELGYVDSAPPTGINHYRVRVSQRNGHMAWSSPIWVDNT